jgi:uncharacterized protein with HEPN domain
MSRRDPLMRVRHMVDHAREAVQVSRGRIRPDLDRDRQLNLALVRLMEIVGEAASRVPGDFRKQHPGIPWREVSDFRNRLIHGYDMVVSIGCGPSCRRNCRR